ncbi:helix-turn-helix transcriptional regulator [Amycolatopsis sp. NPDC051102]|uniref:response regulator transcription factor n=1 Tax=Amycolatopsis sp. NPDC051102 TaxID=3155163 RepID=UPI0034461182
MAVQTGNPVTGEALTTRERQVAEHVVRGYTYDSIARRLNISPHTVDTYVRRIKLKLGVANRAQLIVSVLDELRETQVR